jgi:fatty-acyl-CoA synthase
MSSKETWIRALARTAEIEREPRVTLPVIVDRLAERFHAATAILSPEASLSYAELGARSNRYSRWALAEGLGKGDVVALLAPNCAEYLPMWLGLTRIGATVALLNNQLTGESLAHSIRIAAPKQVLVAAALGAAFEGVRSRLAPDLVAWVHGRSPADLRPLIPAIEAQSGDPLGLSEYTPPSLDELALYIYTSGTTGLPKAARVSHHRVMQWSHWFAGLLDTRPEDRMYDCLPLYHSVGGVVATGATLLGGGTVILRPRFSASEFWRDVVSERCTLFQYIGELCRYLLNTPPCPEESRHTLRVACGNGLRPEVWKPFQERFRIPAILEYYAATEANFSLYNVEGEPGAIGRIPAFLAARLQTTLVRVDPDSGEPRRTTEGLCERCDVDEPGEALGLVPEGEGRSGQFEGYTDGVASSKKILRDVLKPGDTWYRTGDLMRRDARGFYYFVDRLGDTYRWKGENVSTTEVLAALSHCRGVLEGVAYGVQVPGADGRAGMAALVVTADFDLAEFRREASSRLPDYARPVFLRLLPELAATATFKPLKQELVRDGFDPHAIRDPLYVEDRAAGGYVPLDAVRYARICAGELRV